MVEFLTYKQMIRQHGVSVIAVTEPIVENEDAQLYIDAINGASGELYLRKLSKDSKRGIRAKVVERHEHLGFAPYGYRYNPKKPSGCSIFSSLSLTVPRTCKSVKRYAKQVRRPARAAHGQIRRSNTH